MDTTTALAILKKLIDVSTAAGTFPNADGVIQAVTAYNTIAEKIKESTPTK